MAELKVSLLDPMQDWVEAQVRRGGHASASEYLWPSRPPRQRLSGRAITLEELRAKLAAPRDSGVDGGAMEDIFAEACRTAVAPRPGDG